MKKFLGSLVTRFSSRKFLLTVAGLILVQAFPDQAGIIATIIGIFVGGEASIDAIRAYSEKKYVAPVQALDAGSFFSNGEEDDVDTTRIVPGS